MFKIIQGNPKYFQLEIPSEWDHVKLDELFDFIKGKVPKEIFDEDQEERVPYLTSQNLNGTNLEFVNKSDGILVNESDIILSVDGTVGKTYFFKKGILASTFLLLRKKVNIKINTEFIYYYLILNYNLLKNTQYGTGVPHIDKFILRNLLVPIPSDKEQLRISQILLNLDELIKKQSILIQKVQELKLGRMQELFTKGIGHENEQLEKVVTNFKKTMRIPKKWRMSNLAKEFKFSSGNTPRREKSEFFKGEIPWVTTTDLNRGRITETIEKITHEAMIKTNLKIYPKGTFVIAIYGLEAAGTRGKCGILEIDSTINQACLAFHKSNTITTEFIYQYFLYQGEKIAFHLAQGTKQQNLNKDVLKFAKIAVPPITEQDEIVQILKNLDSLIEQKKQYKEKLENLKKGLMQQLLTGKKRVIV